MGRKVFGIGLAKMGSISLQQACRILGYKSLHYPVSYQEIDDHDFINGTSVACRFQAIDTRYPQSKFILTMRDLEPWLQSCEAHYCQRFRQEDLEPRHRAFRKRNMLKLYGTDTFNMTLFAEAYVRHINAVQTYFAQRTKDLLILNIPAGDGWETLCPFLGHPLPDSPFPHTNRSSQPITLRDEVANRVKSVPPPWIDEEEGALG
jgi:hypothetical protein